eukprot:4031846-Heterocapsa_arctica.AAC.1
MLHSEPQRLTWPQVRVEGQQHSGRAEDRVNAEDGRLPDEPVGDQPDGLFGRRFTHVLRRG